MMWSSLKRMARRHAERKRLDLASLAGRNLAARREAVARQNFQTTTARLMGATGKDSEVLRKIVGA